MASALFRTKSFEAIQEESADTEHGLRRALGPVNLITIGIGAIIGAGIFVLTGEAAARHTGPAIVISFMLSGTACAFAGLCYAEFASMIPIAGSAYTYAYATLGELLAWIIGWDLVLEYALGATTVAVGWSGYFVSFLDRNLGIHIPPELTAGPYAPVKLADGTEVVGFLNLPAILVLAVATLILVIGIRESANINSAIVVLKVAIVLVFLAAGVGFVNAANWRPFIPENTGTFGEYGWSGIFRGAALVFFAYIGFDAVSTAAQEAKNPQRDMPIGILGSLAICTVLYISVAAVVTGIVHYEALKVPDPIAVAIDSTGLTWLSPLIKLGAIVGLGSVILVMLLGQTRILYTMSKDGLLPAWLGHVHPGFRTPWLATLVTGAACALGASFAPIKSLAELVNIGTLLAFVIVCASVLVLRRAHPEIPRPFKTPGMPFVPLGGIASCLALMASLPGSSWVRLFIWMAIGMAIYFVYGTGHSRAASRSAVTDRESPRRSPGRP
jgi:APA family basic amino acid/polyamine antiporter